LLQLKELVCNRDERALFTPLTLSVTAGDCVEVLGPNGAGKTTLLRTLAGLHTQYSGSYQVELFLYQGHRVALDELMTPLENLAWYGALQGLKFDQHQLREVLAHVGMVGLALTPCQQLSQGQQRRVSMARWLLSPAKLWLLDEPYTSLDQEGQTLLNAILAQHCDTGGAVLAATHVPLTVGNPRQLHVTPTRAAERYG
jgi:heme exporter protein A